jgi:O-antigen/teichoic acid export membrane protein
MLRDVAKGVAKNTGVLLVQQVITMTSGFLLLLFIPRYLGPEEYGRFYLATAITGIFAMFVSFGSNFYISKEVVRAPESTGQVLVDSIAARFTFAMLSVAAIVVLCEILGYQGEQKLLILILSVSLLLLAGTNTLYACYQGHQRLSYTSLGAIAERVSIGVLTIPLLLLGAGARMVAAVCVLGILLNLLVLVVKARTIVPSLPRVRWRGVRDQVTHGVPYFLLSVFGVVYYRIDSIMLSKMTPEKIVGFYGAAYRLFDSLNIPYLLSIAVYPVLARYWKDAPNIHQRMLLKSLEVVIVAAIPVTIATIFFASDIISLLYGLNAYGESVILLQVLSAGILFLYVDMILATALVAADRQRSLAIIAFIAIPFNIGLNMLMIPYCQMTFDNGAIGSAVATGVTEMCIMVVSASLLPGWIRLSFRWGVVGKSLVAGLAMSASILLLPHFIPWFICAGFSLLVYCGVLWLTKPLEPGEDQFLRDQATSALQSLLSRFRRASRTPAPEQNL